MSTLARIVAIISLFPTLIFACLWDSDTIRDEIQARPSLFELVTGHLPHHGKAYYEARVDRLEPKRDRSREETNDLAVALIRLGRFDEARALLQAQLAKEPDRYITLSNLGVLHKKQGDYARAADYIHQALAIKPEGHMGLGGWYEKALAWRARRETETSPPIENFLGDNYDKQKPSIEGSLPLTGDRKEQFEKLQNLLRNDQGFADGFPNVGDHQEHQGHGRHHGGHDPRGLQIGRALGQEFPPARGGGRQPESEIVQGRECCHACRYRERNECHDNGDGIRKNVTEHNLPVVHSQSMCSTHIFQISPSEKFGSDHPNQCHPAEKKHDQ